MGIQYLKGDATNPEGSRLKIIAHVVNNKGGWGKGFVVPLGERYPYAERRYREWAKGISQGSLFNGNPPFELGEVQFVVVGDHRIVANMCAQDGYRQRYDDPSVKYVQYGHLSSCLAKLAIQAIDLNASVVMPRIGSGLGGGDWDTIADMIDSLVCALGVSVTVYDL